MTLRGALGCSAAFHVVLLLAAPPVWLARTPKPQFEVSYIPAAPAPVVPPAPAPAPRISAPPVVEKPAPPPIPPAPRVVTPPPPLPAGPRQAAPPPQQQHREAEIAPKVRPAISSLPEKEFIFVDHKEAVRKHLRARLRYPSFLSDGAVRIRVFLTPEGAFKQATVIEASDARLTAIAIRDAQAAAPYPPLPGKVRPRQLRYEFLVRYKPE